MSFLLEPRILDADCTEPRLVALLGRIVHRDHRAMRELHAAIAPHVFCIARPIVRSGDCAQEVLGDVLVRVWSTASSYDVTAGSVLAWITHAARQCALKWSSSAQDGDFWATNSMVGGELAGRFLQQVIDYPVGEYPGEIV
jgi:DNA-directed RNA polymerase specialized sigma24 family protein